MKQLYYAIQMIVRGKDSSVIKIVSLSLGLLISIILFARVVFEFNYDNFYEDTDRLFLVETVWKDDKGMGDYGHYVIFPTGQVFCWPDLSGKYGRHNLMMYCLFLRCSMSEWRLPYWLSSWAVSL